MSSGSSEIGDSYEGVVRFIVFCLGAALVVFFSFFFPRLLQVHIIEVYNFVYLGFDCVGCVVVCWG